ncbi:class I adenylate-forming enzyme family protein [Streptomyces sp. NRRL S-1022]|uniref:AMP-binding protein n=1 Tax=Streptomyces sp. NRRL S-1022 TaxID=1463880 RepID=UPI0004C1EA3C
MTNVLDPVCRHAAAAPDDVALRGAGGRWTYRRLYDGSTRYAGALAAAGLSPGDRVLLAVPSVPEFVVAYLGIQAAGCVVVQVNTMATRAEVACVLGDAGCSLAVAWHALGPAVAEAAASLGVPFRTLHPGASLGEAGPADVIDRDRRGDRRPVRPRHEHRPYRHRAAAVPCVRAGGGHDGDADRCRPGSTRRRCWTLVRVHDHGVGFKYSLRNGHHRARGDRRRDRTARGAPLVPA